MGYGHLNIDERPRVVNERKRIGGWERGTNENTNGLLRQFFPKGMDFGMVIKLDVDIALEQLNNRPRKCSNYPDTSGQRSSGANVSVAIQIEICVAAPFGHLNTQATRVHYSDAGIIIARLISRQQVRFFPLEPLG
jgi:hypothetical protein